jgi:hypothetical protein
MTILSLDLISSFRKTRPKKVLEHPQLFMAGLNQKIFLSHWGEPETQITLNQLDKLNKLRPMFSIPAPIEEGHLSVWIYKKKNSVLLFAKEKLVFHFSCKELKSSFAGLPISLDTPPIAGE